MSYTFKMKRGRSLVTFNPTSSINIYVQSLVVLNMLHFYREKGIANACHSMNSQLNCDSCVLFNNLSICVFSTEITVTKDRSTLKLPATKESTKEALCSNTSFRFLSCTFKMKRSRTLVTFNPTSSINIYVHTLVAFNILHFYRERRLCQVMTDNASPIKVCFFKSLGIWTVFCHVLK